MKYSAAFAASVASKPDLNAYSGHLFFLARELHGNKFPIHT